MAPSRAQKDDVVQMGGKTLKRVMDNETRQWVYRPVDESSGKVISKEAFEAMKREEAKAIEVVAHYTQDEEQAYCMLYGEGVFDTIPIEARPRAVLAHPRRPLAVR